MSQYIFFKISGGCGSHVIALLILISILQVQHDIISKMALQDHRKDEFMQPFNQFGQVFAGERGDEAKQRKGFFDSTSGTSISSMECDQTNDNGSDSTVNPNLDEDIFDEEHDWLNDSLIGGDQNVTNDDEDALGPSNEDDSIARNVQFAIDFTNARIPR